MAEIDTTNAGFNSGKRFGEATKTTEESKQASPAKSVSSADTRESAASSADAKEVEENQILLPLWIRERTYSRSAEKADKELWDDIREEDEASGGSFLDQEFLKHIFIDAETRKAYINMPSTYHDVVVHLLSDVFSNESSEDNPILVRTNGSVKTTGGKREPDVLIYGKDRITCTTRKRKRVIKKKEPYLNPSAIIEVSWTNKIENELEKFAVQMNNCDGEHGRVNVGYLIKFIPSKTNELPVEETSPDRPLVGIDVYRMEPGDSEPTPGQPFSSWRCGENYPDDLEITREELGHGQGTEREGASISFEEIVEKLDTGMDVVFEQPGET